MTTITEIIQGIKGLETIGELEQVYKAYREQHKEVHGKKTWVSSQLFKVGDKVEFTYRGIKRIGTIVSKGSTNAKVLVVDTSFPWSVPYVMLRKTDGKGEAR